MHNCPDSSLAIVEGTCRDSLATAPIDMENGNIISITKKNHPQLNEKNLLLLGLTAIDFTCVQIATILGYSNSSNVGPVRQRLANKMNLDVPLSQYIQQFMQAE